MITPAQYRTDQYRAEWLNMLLGMAWSGPFDTLQLSRFWESSHLIAKLWS
jgi:hypothetical protein